MGTTSENTDKVFLHGLVFYGYHGVGAAEKARGQRFIVDITMECDTRAAGASDNLEGRCGLCAGVTPSPRMRSKAKAKT